jgi:hypothetical protein
MRALGTTAPISSTPTPTSTCLPHWTLQPHVPDLPGWITIVALSLLALPAKAMPLFAEHTEYLGFSRVAVPRG